jgi:hypothetical protein
VIPRCLRYSQGSLGVHEVTEMCSRGLRYALGDYEVPQVRPKWLKCNCDG